MGSGTGALLLLTAGILLVFLECNRPGRVVPGALGMLLLLLGGHRMLALAAPPTALVLAVLGVAMLLLLWWQPGFGLSGFPGLLGSLGTLLFTWALVRWSEAAGTAPRWLAVLCGLLLGSLAALLLLLAGRARQAKRRPSGALASAAPAGGHERWGVD